MLKNESIESKLLKAIGIDGTFFNHLIQRDEIVNASLEIFNNPDWIHPDFDSPCSACPVVPDPDQCIGRQEKSKEDDDLAALCRSLGSSQSGNGSENVSFENDLV